MADTGGDITHWAHSGDGEPPEGWQTLETHLNNVAELAESFASVFGAGEWGRLAGLLHDCGKASKEFQEKLLGRTMARVDHSTFGARLADELGGKLGKLLAYAIAGHHGGIPDGGDSEGQLHYRLQCSTIPEVPPIGCPSVESFLKLPFGKRPENLGFSLAFFIRMVFSCLVDADFLDTEKHMNPKNSALRPNYPDIPFLKNKLDLFLKEKVRSAKPGQVNNIRKEILEQCLEKSSLRPQFFSLTVPTGGGKTLSSLAFSLKHADIHRMNRVIYAVPFTSIIEQNAQVFREALGDAAILEHHCNYKFRDDPEWREYEMGRSLAAENWDVPVVVTTNVQFFQSLFDNRPSRCRKLHNVAGSVIILDEAQAIPTEYLEPCLAALRELVERYGCSVLICTATQPALDDSKIRNALGHVEEIVRDRHDLYGKLKRVDVQFVGPVSDAELTGKLAAEDQVLCIVHTKPHARDLFESLVRQIEDPTGAFHLSTNMYPAHRSRVLETIRKTLKAGRPCRVISTSLVEVGVDLDFPVVYRARAGLDSIAQAAGRCNREGQLSGRGKVFVFDPEKPPRMPWMQRCGAKTNEIIRHLADNADPLGLDAMRRYFELLYSSENLDKKNILDLLKSGEGSQLVFPFREISKCFRFIEDDGIGVIIVSDPEAENLVNDLRYTEFPRPILRKLQQYSVSIRNHELKQLLAQGSVDMVREDFPLLAVPMLYRQDVGLCVDAKCEWGNEHFYFD